MTSRMARGSAGVNSLAVVIFALSMLFHQTFISYLSSLVIALSFMPMMAAIADKGAVPSKLAGTVGIGFAIIYVTINALVYFAQLTSVYQGHLSLDAQAVLDYQQFGLFFNYNLLGYGFMALSTFFVSFTIADQAKNLRRLLMIHGIFAIACFTLPLMGIFSTSLSGVEWIGTAVLLIWCLYFFPVGVLAYRYFNN